MSIEMSVSCNEKFVLASITFIMYNIAIQLHCSKDAVPVLLA